ncbi:MAG: hypothetical protein ACRC5T_10025 [Cetobacterium sp.]
MAQFIIWTTNCEVTSPSGKDMPYSTVILEWIDADEFEEALDIFNLNCREKYENLGYKLFNITQCTNYEMYEV